MRKNIKGNVSSDAEGKNDCQKGVWERRKIKILEVKVEELTTQLEHR